MSNYTTEIFSTYSIQSCKNSTTKSERIGSKALYAFVYPCWMLNAYENMVDINIVIPVTHDTSIIEYYYYFKPNASEKFIHESLKASDTVQMEDSGICEDVQQGLGSKYYSQGRYANPESGAYHFHTLLYKDLQHVL